MTEPGALTSDEYEQLDFLHHMLTEHPGDEATLSGTILIRGRLGGEDVAIVAASVPTDDGGGVEVRPMAVLMTDLLFDLIEPLDGLDKVRDDQ